MSTNQSIITIICVAAGTMLTRFLPFIIFPEGKKPPRIITYLGTVLPFAALGLLIVYCLKDVSVKNGCGIPEALAILLVVLLHKWKKNTLLSIAGGTVFYMFLVQMFF